MDIIKAEFKYTCGKPREMLMTSLCHSITKLALVQCMSVAKAKMSAYVCTNAFNE